MKSMLNLAGCGTARSGAPHLPCGQGGGGRAGRGGPGPEASERSLRHGLVYLLLLPPFTRPTRVKDRILYLRHMSWACPRHSGF